MEKLSFSTRFFLDNNSAIFLRITVNRKKAELGTKRSVNPKKWNDETQRAKGDAELNGYLIHIENEIRRIHSRLIQEKQDVTAKLIKDLYLGKDEKSLPVLDYVADHVKEMESLVTEYKPATLNRFKTVHKHLSEFLSSISESHLPLHRFQLKHVSQFDHFLKTKKKVSLNSSAKYLKILKSIFLKANRLQLIDRDPFFGHKFKTVIIEKEFLTPNELSLLESSKMPNESLEKVKDVFLFACYTGLRFSDVFALGRENLKKENGQIWLSIKTIMKTGKALRMPILKKALTITEKYSKESAITGKLLPAISNQKTNAYLKVIADLSGIDKKLTYHCARHTFATTVTLSNKVPLEVVSKLLGHSSIRSTEIYAKITDTYLSEMTTTLNKKLK